MKYAWGFKHSVHSLRLTYDGPKHTHPHWIKANFDLSHTHGVLDITLMIWFVETSSWL